MWMRKRDGDGDGDGDEDVKEVLRPAIKSAK